MADILPVDQLEVLVLLDNVTDSLSTNSSMAISEWTGLLTAGRLQLLSGRCTCCAHHGLSLLITVRLGNAAHTVLFDTGPEASTFLRNAESRLRYLPAHLQPAELFYLKASRRVDKNATFKLDATIGGTNWFGIQSFASYNIRDLLSTSTNFLWSTNRTGADLIANGITVILNGASNNLGQAQYLKLVDVNAPAPGPNVWATADFDADNLPDTWESQYGLNPSDASGIDGAAGDRDGDGATNYEEFLAGTDPSDRASRLRVTYAARAGTVFNLDFDSVPFLDYGIEYSYTLANWTDCIEETGLPCRITADSTNTAFEIALPQPTAPPNIFFRVKRQR